jgi:hypothetical protein
MQSLDGLTVAFHFGLAIPALVRRPYSAGLELVEVVLETPKSWVERGSLKR